MRRPCGTFDESYDQDMSILRTRAQWLWLAGALILAAMLPLFAGDILLSLLINMGVLIISALGLNILIGYCGQISMGQAAFMGLGAFAGANLVSHLLPDSAWGFWLAIPVSGLAAGLGGLIFGFPSLRIKGMYLALTTLAASFIIDYALLHFAGGDLGIRLSPVRIGSFAFDSDKSYFYIILVFVLLAIFLAKNIVRGKDGRAFIMIRDNERAAEALGISVLRYKLTAFFIGCFFAGVAGCLWTFYISTAKVESYGLWDSIWLLGMLVIGGFGSITGTILGVFFVRGLRELTNLATPALAVAIPSIPQGLLATLPVLIFSIVTIVFLIVEPRGLAHRWEIIKSWYRLWPFGYR